MNEIKEKLDIVLVMKTRIGGSKYVWLDPEVLIKRYPEGRFKCMFQTYMMVFRELDARHRG